VGDSAKSNLGACLLRQGKLDDAIAIFQELLTSPTHAEQARSNLGAITEFMRQSGAGGKAFPQKTGPLPVTSSQKQKTLPVARKGCLRSSNN
jgi:Tfp pilus assembly protein PilF